MNEELSKKWDEAHATGKAIPVGDLVVCDLCDEDFTTRPDIGGFIFGTNAYCPACAEKSVQRIREYGEEHFIRAWAGPTEAFADFVRRYRGPNSVIRVTKLP